MLLDPPDGNIHRCDQIIQCLEHRRIARSNADHFLNEMSLLIVVFLREASIAVTQVPQLGSRKDSAALLRRQVRVALLAPDGSSLLWISAHLASRKTGQLTAFVILSEYL
jgi:hypothetical protein